MYTFDGSIVRTPPPQEICDFGAARITGQGGGAFLPSSLVLGCYSLRQEVLKVDMTNLSIVLFLVMV